MKKILLSMAAVGALAAAAPAMAQTGYYGTNINTSAGISDRVAQLEARLNAGIQTGVISRTEARELRMDLRDLRRLERQYSYGGFTAAERQDLRTRLRTLREDIRLADNGRYDRDNRYGRWNDPYYNNDVYTGQGGPYEEPYDTYCDSNSRGVIGGVIDNVLGRSDNCYNLRVGSRATGNLYSVPSQYRYRYRDGNGVYYRSDGRNIYQIDARTQTVLRVYGID
jgi:hypothetical protein